MLTNSTYRSTPTQLGVPVVCWHSNRAVDGMQAAKSRETPLLNEDEWASLVESINEGRCTPFLGAGIGYPHLPLGASLARALASEYGYPLGDVDNLPRVAQYVSILRGGPLLKRDVIRKLRAEELAYYTTHLNQPPENYQILAGLNQRCYVTTNYDGFMERALDGVGHRPTVETCRWRDQLWAKLGDYPNHSATVENPILFHLHGRLDDDLSILVTEDDYIDFTVTLAVRGAQDASQSVLSEPNSRGAQLQYNSVRGLQPRRLEFPRHAQIPREATRDYPGQHQPRN